MLSSHRKLGRDPKRRNILMCQLLNNMARSRILKTSLARAKELKRIFDRTVRLFQREQFNRVGYVQRQN
jgi:ribosomal protein L17